MGLPALASGRPPKRLLLVAGALALIVVVGLGGLVVLGALSAPRRALPAPHFADETATSGVVHAYTGGFDYFEGGGVAAFDCDGDRKPDLYIAGGSSPAALYHNESTIGGALRFSQVPSAVTDLTGVTGAYPVDIDGDGITDLVVLRYGQNVLLRGLGGCRFERANERWGFDGGDAWTTAFSATWEGSSTLPTLAFGNYRNEATNDSDHLCFDNALVRPSPSGSGYAAPTPLSPGWCALSMLFSDWGHSGHRDLRVTNDKHYYLYTEGGDQLWQMLPGQPPRLYAAADGWQPLQINGMGIASQDLNGDGMPEVFLSNQADSRLQTLAGNGSSPEYRDMSLQAGVSAGHPYSGPDMSLPSTAWHAEFQDVNNDGYMDLFVAKGNIDAVPDFAAQDPSDLFIGQSDGSFVEGAVDAGIVTFDKGRGAALVDLNLDGLLDLVEVFREANVKVWRNVGAGEASAPRAMGHWLGLRPHESGANPDAIGAWVEVKVGDRVIQRELTVGGGHAGGQLGWVHFGLGDATSAQVRVQWPDGTMGPWLPVHADAFAVLERDGDSVQPWAPTGP